MIDRIEISQKLLSKPYIRRKIDSECFPSEEGVVGKISVDITVEEAKTIIGKTKRYSERRKKFSFLNRSLQIVLENERRNDNRRSFKNRKRNMTATSVNKVLFKTIAKTNALYNFQAELIELSI